MCKIGKVNLDMTDLLNTINSFYGEWLPECKITKNVSENLVRVLEQKRNENPGMEIEKFLQKDITISYIRSHQPNLSRVPDHVVERVKDYFKINLPQYEVSAVYRNSNHPADANMYSVIGKTENGKYSCWTSWNNSIGSLNHGHHNMSLVDAQHIIDNNFYDITGEQEKYGAKCSGVILDQALVEQNVIEFEQYVRRTR